jgi:hypothetical protein
MYFQLLGLLVKPSIVTGSMINNIIQRTLEIENKTMCNSIVSINQALIGLGT